MNYVMMVVILISLLSGSALAGETSGDSQGLQSSKNRISYSVGYQIGEDFNDQNTDIKSEAFMQGVKDAMQEAEPQLSPEEMNSTLLVLKKKIVTREKAKKIEKQKDLKVIKEKYQGEGRAFLSENSKKEGVVTLPSGLQYKVIRNGDGMMPGPNDNVTVYYRGTLIDGTEFDSSNTKGEPASFHVDGVIKGWTEALQLMKEGAKWQLFIPADLAYGERGPLADKAVIFDIELVSVQSLK